MKKVSKWVALAIAVTLVFSLVGCGGEESATGENTVKLFANFGGDPQNPKDLDKYIFEKAAEATGVTIEWELPPTSGYAERVQIMMASGEYPDAVFFPSLEDQGYRNAMDSEIVLDLTPYITEETTPNLLKYSYDVSWDAVKYYGDDRIMAIPRTSLSRNEGCTVRSDFIENVGFGEIFDRENNDVDAAEFQEIARRITYDDPDGNGQNDTYGYGGFIDAFTQAFGPIEFAPRLFGDIGWSEYPNEEYKYMTPRYSRVSDSYKQQLQMTQDMYTAKLIDPDSPSLKSQDAVDRFNQGRTGMTAGFAGHLITNQEKLNASVPDGEVGYIFGRDASGKVQGNNYSTGFLGQWCIFKNCENPEAILKLFDWMLSDEAWNMTVYGVEGVNYDMQDGEKVYRSGEQYTAPWADAMLRRTGDFDYFTKAHRVKPEYEYKLPELEKVFNICQNTLVFSLDGGYNPPISKDTAFINYNTKMAEEITKISTGALPVSEYDNILEGWYQAGGEQYVQDMNAYIEKMQANN